MKIIKTLRAIKKENTQTIANKQTIKTLRAIKTNANNINTENNI